MPPNHNSKETVPKEFRGLPVSIKTAKYGAPIGFGDAIRQFKVEEDFLLIVGFWRQHGSMKNFVAVDSLRITTHLWQNLWSPLSLKELQTLDALIKDYETNYVTVRREAKAMKSNSPFNSAKMVLNPKIDSGSQRRLQCSLPFKTFWNDVAKKEPLEMNPVTLFGQPVPNLTFSPSRKFKRF